MSRILTLIAAAGLLSLAACQSTPKATAQDTSAQPAAQTATAETPASPAQAPAAEAAPAPAPAVEQAPAKPMKAAEPVAAAPAPMKAAPKPAPKAKSHVAARPRTISKDQALALARKGNCLNCHKIEKRVVGPAWKNVAAKYRGKPNAVATITAHIKKGGSFGWKYGFMPPRGGSNLSDADVAKLAGFIAGLK